MCRARHENSRPLTYQERAPKKIEWFQMANWFTEDQLHVNTKHHKLPASNVSKTVELSFPQQKRVQPSPCNNQSTLPNLAISHYRGLVSGSLNPNLNAFLPESTSALLHFNRFFLVP